MERAARALAYAACSPAASLSLALEPVAETRGKIAGTQNGIVGCDGNSGKLGIVKPNEREGKDRSGSFGIGMPGITSEGKLGSDGNSGRLGNEKPRINVGSEKPGSFGNGIPGITKLGKAGKLGSSGNDGRENPSTNEGSEKLGTGISKQDIHCVFVPRLNIN